MKKSLVTLGLAVCALSPAIAQTNTAAENSLKPVKGNVVTEIGLSGGLLNSEYELNGNLGMIKGRYFLQDDLAIRVGFRVGVDNEKEHFYGAGSNKGTVSTTMTDVFINLGIEKHFAGTNRLSPYVGADILFGNNYAKTKGVETDGNAFDADQSFKISSPFNLSLGIQGVIGADYYIAPKVFLGAEFGLGIVKTWDGKTTTEVTNGANTVTATIKSPGSELSLNPHVNGAIRIGFVLF